jgi:hypothetical protein
MPTTVILKQYTAGELRKELMKAGKKGVAKATKAEMIKMMMKDKATYHHLRGKGDKKGPKVKY